MQNVLWRIARETLQIVPRCIMGTACNFSTGQSEALYGGWMRTDKNAIYKLRIDGLTRDAAAHAALLHVLILLLRNVYRRWVFFAYDGDQDRVKETFIAVDTQRSTYAGNRRFSAGLLAIPRHKTIDRIKRSACLQPLVGREDELASNGFKDRLIVRLDDKRLLATPASEQARMIRSIRLSGLNLRRRRMRTALGSMRSRSRCIAGSRRL